MQFNPSVVIAGKEISHQSNTFIIAEAGVNHNGDLNQAKKLIDIAAEAGVDAVKFQSFKTEALILGDVEKAPYQQKTTTTAESQFEMLKKLEIDMEAHRMLMDYCASKGVLFLTTPFDLPSLHALDELGLPAYKVSSTDLTNLPFLEEVAKKGKPIILSTGMSYLTEVEMALRTIHPHNKDVILLHCTANYPITDDEANLLVIDTLNANFEVVIGFSDHSVGPGASPYAVAMGARLIEKHFTIDRSLPGPDHKASLSPEQLTELVARIRQVEIYLGSPEKKPTLAETRTRKSLQKSIVCLEPIEIGQEFTSRNITTKRTGGQGISALYFSNVLGRMATRDYTEDDIIEL